MTENLIKYSVFYSAKHLDNSSTLECAVHMMPLHEQHTTAYTFTTVLTKGSVRETENVENVTCDRSFAEHIFNLLCGGNVYPCHLLDVIYDLTVLRDTE